MKKQELRELTRGELEQRLLELQDERFTLVMRRSLKALDNPLRLRTIRREAAQINTMLREDELGIRVLAQSKTSILSAMDSGKADTK
jgi:large subunit ribosomal protein L29